MFDIIRSFLKLLGKQDEYKTCPYNALYINLDKRIDRKQRFLKQVSLYDIKVTRIPGEVINSYAQIENPPYKNIINIYWDTSINALYDINVIPRIARLTLSEIGCAYSHIRAWMQVKNADQPMLIFEDDAILCPKFTDELQEYVQACPDDYDMLMLSFLNAGDVEFMNQYIYAPTYGFTLVGYLLHPRGARKLLESLPLTGPVDVFIHTVVNIKMYCTTKLLVTQPVMGSEDIRYSSHGH